MRGVKVTLSTSKVVLLRDMKIRDTELAAQAVAPRANGDANLLQVFMNAELVKLLLVRVDDKDITASDRESLDDLFTMAEYSQVLSVVKVLSGGEDAAKKPQLEVVSSGGK
jgi:hypothetical protein